MVDKVSAALGPQEAARLAASGAATTRGAKNLAEITKQGLDDVVDPNDVKKIAGLAATAVAKTKSPGLVVQGADAIVKAVRGLGMTPGAARKLAELATSADGAEKVIDYLRRAKVGNTAIQKIATALGIPYASAVATE